MVIIVIKDRFVLKVYKIEEEQRAIDYVKKQCELKGFKRHEFDLIYKWVE